MQRPFDVFEQIGNAVQADPRPPRSEIASPHAERPAPHWGSAGGEAATKGFVHHCFERAAASPRHRLQLRRHVVIKRNRRSHILMLLRRHHDVKRARK